MLTDLEVAKHNHAHAKGMRNVAKKMMENLYERVDDIGKFYLENQMQIYDDLVKGTHNALISIASGEFNK